MKGSISLRCRCGTMAGVATDLAPEEGNHVVCYCGDCQAFARFLGVNGVLDEHGGTEIFQTTPSRVRLTQGNPKLRCVRLSEKGLLRFYAGCCRTPIGNMVPYPRVPFIGLIASFMEDGIDGRSRDAILGPIAARLNTESAVGGVPTESTAAQLRALARGVPILLRAFVAGAHQPSAFFDARARRPVATPEVLSSAQRQSLRPAVMA